MRERRRSLLLSLSVAALAIAGCGTDIQTPASAAGAGGGEVSSTVAAGGMASGTGGVGGVGGVGGATSPSDVGVVYNEKKFEVKVTEDVVFAQGLTHSSWGVGDGTPMDLLLDVYEPVRDNPAPMPVVVVIHGGGFVGGSKGHQVLSGMARGFAERGWVSFSIDYRVASHAGTLPAGYPDAPQGATAKQADQWRALYPACRDAKAAIRWIRAHADDYSLATDHVAAIGGSAGSFLALALGVSDEADCVGEVSSEADPTLADTHVEQSSRVQTIVDHWGGTAVITMLEMLGGAPRFDATDAPVSIVHGTEDPTVPFSQAEAIRDAYQTTGAPYAFYPLEGLGHGPWNAQLSGQSLTELAFDFIVLQQKLVVE